MSFEVQSFLDLDKTFSINIEVYLRYIYKLLQNVL